MEWLTSEKETEFVANTSDLQAKIEEIKANKQLLDAIKNPNVEERNLLISGANSVSLDNWALRKQMPPYAAAESKEYLGIVGDYVAAQNQLFGMIEKDGFIYPDELPFVHATLVRTNEDIAVSQKGRFRNASSPFVQTPYFDATPGAKVNSEIAAAFMQYSFMTGNFENDIVNIAKLHAQFVRIQPFMCANKRMAFIVTNALLKLDGFSPITICKTKEENEQYLSALKAGILDRDVTSLTQFFLDKELQAQQDEIDQATVEMLGKTKSPNIIV